ncbi:MAG: CPBP family intramembrane metalloprotease, partial [Prevotella sp.]|nr:CPBP family intramembrane metalloprotease [Prevotella sp.]
GVVFHWTNNTIAYILCNILPDPNITLTEFYHGNTQSVLLSVLFSLCIFIPSLLQLNRMMKKA